MKAVLDTSALINILVGGGLTFFNLILSRYDGFLATSKLEKEYKRKLANIVKKPDERKNIEDQLNKFDIVRLPSEEVKLYYKTQNEFLTSLGKKVNLLSIVDAECLYMVKKGYADILISDDIACWLVAGKEKINYSSSILEAYALNIEGRINLTTFVKFASTLFSTAGWKLVRGYKADIALREYLKVVLKAIINSKDILKSSILKSDEEQIPQYLILTVIENILGCD